MPIRKFRNIKNSVFFQSLQILNRRDRILTLFVVILQIVFALLDLVGVTIVGLIGSLAVSGVSGNRPGNKVYSFLSLLRIQDSNLQFQVTLLGLIAASFLSFKSILTLYFNRKSSYFLSRRGAQVSRILIQKLLGQDLLKINERSLMETINIVTSGVTTITVGILGTFIFLISDVSLLLILGIGLFVVDTVIAVSTLALFATVAILLYKLLNLKVKKLGEEQNRLVILSNEKIGEVVSSFREIFVRDRRYYYADAIGNLRLSLADTVAELIYLPNISKYAIEITLVLGALGIAGFQFITQPAGHAVAVLSIFLVSSARIAPAVLRVQQGLLNIKGSIGTAAPTLGLIKELSRQPILEKDNNIIDFEHRNFIPTVNIKKVSFIYPNTKQKALEEVSLNIDQGMSVAIVGPSGSGKTTLVDLMLGLLPISNGSCEISDMKVKDAIKNWPGALAYVPQDVVINNGSIAKNVTMGFELAHVKEDKIWRALEVAHLSDFVKSLPDNIHTNVGDHGKKISGGQRQRLGIARALYTNPKLLVMDEATSSLDGETEAAITESINLMKGKITVVTIAHRLSTVRNCDLVVYLESGRVKAVGSFEEVRKKIPNFDKAAKLMGL